MYPVKYLEKIKKLYFVFNDIYYICLTIVV